MRNKREKDYDDVRRDRVGCLLWIVIIATIAILASCKPVPYVIQDVRMTIRGNVARFKPMGKAAVLKDTVMDVKLIRRRS